MRLTVLVMCLVVLLSVVVFCKEHYLLVGSCPSSAVTPATSVGYELLSQVGASMGGVSLNESYVLVVGDVGGLKREEAELGVRAKVFERTQFAFKGTCPNPFSQETQIGFSVGGLSGSTGPATVGIYDVKGRLVVELLSEELACGSHEVVWDGRDGEGRRVPSGVYFVRVRSGERSATGRVVVLR